MHEQIIKNFINQFKTKHSKDNIEVIGILGFGSSFNQKNLSPNSDLDIYIVIKNIGKRYRGIMLIDNIEIDYFINPIEQLKADWEKVRNKIVIKKTIAYMLKDGKIILDQNNELKKMQEEARKFLKDELKINGISDYMLVLGKYFIEDYLKDIEDSLIDKNIFSWQYNANSLLNYLIEVFCQFHRIPLVKLKYQGMEIAKRDKKFIELYKLIAKTSSIKEKSKRIKKLALYCLESLGGKLPREWELESPINLL